MGRAWIQGYYTITPDSGVVTPEIVKIDTIEFSYTSPDVTVDGNGFNLVDELEANTDRKLFAIRIHTAVGTTGWPGSVTSG